MKRELIFLVMVSMILAAALVFVSWQLGNHTGRLTLAQERSDSRTIEIESRLLPLEQDLKRRTAIRSKVSTAFGWLRGKLRI